jgi:hypothetical protein
VSFFIFVLAIERFLMEAPSIWLTAYAEPPSAMKSARRAIAVAGERHSDGFGARLASWQGLQRDLTERGSLG